MGSNPTIPNILSIDSGIIPMINHMTKKFRNVVLLCFHISVSGVLNAEDIHIISSGETLYSLAKRYGISVEDLLAENGIKDPSSLSVNMRLVIPKDKAKDVSKSIKNKFYQVVKGDTYYGIAKRHGLSVAELLRLNRLSKNHVLSIGERLNVGKSNGFMLPNSSLNIATVKSENVTRVDTVPWWPVAGIKKPMEGKLNGVTIKAEPLSYIHVVAEGRVVWTGPYRGFGNVVLIDSGGYIYLYGGNDDLFVNVGQSVSRGSRIGRLGTSGPTGGLQDMYFSVFREGVPIAPEDAPRG